MDRFVEITFDCLPLRSIGRLDIPMDASPKFRARAEHLLQLLQAHGSHNTYFLYNARCVFHLTNEREIGSLEFKFEGLVLTDETDRQTTSSDLRVELLKETCDWLTEPIVRWFHECVEHAVRVEFDRYIAAGDLQKTVERLALQQQQADQQGGYVGMFL